MSNRTAREHAAAAGFAFLASALVCGALLVASMSAAPAQTIVFPSGGNTGGTITTSNGVATGNPHTDQNYVRDASGWTNSNVNSSLNQGVPGQNKTPTLGATTFGGVRK